MHKRKQYMKTALCLLLSAGLVCSDMPFTAFAAENNPQTESVAAIQETAQAQETQSEYSAENHADMEHVKTDSAETAVAERTVEETTSVETAGTQTKETETAEAQTTDVNKSEAVEEEQTQETQILETPTAETEEPSSKEEFSTETDTEEQTETAASETITETEAASDKETETIENAETIAETETETIENAETETESMTEMESVTEEVETITETETEAVTEEVKITETENRLTFSDTDIAHGEYKENGSDITWVIDKDGKLTVEGTGDFIEKKIPSFTGYEPCWSVANKSSIKSAVINVKGMTIAHSLFSECTNLTSVDLSGLDTSNVTNMCSVFSGCISLTSVDLSGLDTGNVTDMSWMFNRCSSLTDVDLKGLNTRNVTDMSSMFKSCYSLTDVDLNGMDTGNVTDMSSMFEFCSSLTNMDLSCLDTHNVTNMERMFYHGSGHGDIDSRLTSVNLSGLNTESVTNISNMFRGCDSLTSVNLSGFDTKNVTDMRSMFSDCRSLASVDVSGFDTKNVTYMGNMFRDCSSLTSVDVSGFDTGNVTDMLCMFHGCSSLTSVDVSGFDTGNVTSMQGMFNGCSNLTSIDVSGFDTGNVTAISGMFSDCSNLTSIDVSGFNTRNVTSMQHMFSYCSSLTSVDVSGFDTRNVGDMVSMFADCTNLTSIDVSGFDTGNVIDMAWMFYNCRNLTNIDMSHFNTEKVKEMAEMFKGCRRLTSLDLSSFDAGNLSLEYDDYGQDMFSGCDSLTQLYTPRNLKGDIALENTWYDMHGTSYTALPKEQTDSMLLYRKYSSSEGTGRLTAKKETTDYFCGDTLNIEDLTVIYYNADGEAAALAQAEYTTNAAEIDMGAAGTKTLTVTYQPSEGEPLTADILLAVRKRFDDTCVTVTLPDADSYSYVYDGSRKNPKPVVAYTEGGETITLKEKTDYTVSYNNNINAYKDGTDAAENAPTLTVTGRRTYSGQVAKTFEIRKAAAPKNEELTFEVTYFSSQQTIRIPMNKNFQGYNKVGCTVGTPAENDEISGSVLAGTPTTDSSMRLTCSLNAGTAGDFVTVPVTFSFDNYEDAILNVKILFKGTPGAEKKKVKISGIEIKDSVYSKTPVSCTGTAKVISETDSTDVTDSVKLTYTYSGTQADGSAYTVSSTAPVNAGSYKLTVAVSPDDKDYTGSAEYSFNITKAPLTITARDMGLKIGAELPKAEDYQYDTAGLLKGDSLIKTPTIACNITDTAKAGTYDITISGADAGMNYNITCKNGTLTVSETGESTAYYTVIFHMNGHGSDITNTGIKEGSLLEKPQDPQAEGYTFTGWYKDQSCTVLWDFAKDTIQSDTTVYAGWKAKDGGTDNDNDTGDKDDSAFADTERTPLADVSAVIANIKTRVYDGSAYEPTVKVTAKINGKKTTLTEGIDYRVLYKDHIKAGTATVTVKGNGIYKGSVSKTYTISPKSVKKLKVITGSTTAAQTGTDIASLPVYVYDGTKRLSYGTDFSLTDYSVTKSTAKVTVTGKGNYTGSTTAKLSIYNVSSDKLINPGNVEAIQPVSYNAGKALKPEPVVTAGSEKSMKLTKNKDYKVQYQNNKNAGTAYVIVTGKGAYRGKVVVPFTIEAAQVTSGVTIKPISAKTYNGKYQRPAPTVIVSSSGKNKKLAKNKDYTVTYKNNRHAGTAEVIVTGKGNYAGMTAKSTFTINPQKITKASLKGTQGNLTLTYSKGILKQGIDYEQPVYGEVQKNKIKVAITGKGDFTGTMQKSVKLQ